MTNQLALIIGALVLLFLGYDCLSADWANTLFLARKLADLIEYLAFWR